ncbi:MULTISPECIES: hypothetical protein [unclassified Crossiella]|uniref:phage tail termination protein n=1 Tax=unclassified Crossiella TaxID=2620835 RepID=UPI001FFF2B8D|nr:MULTISPECIES: hypothetical protein [unclassified Crossiella]MCK2237709.1 hypothetical protein [Crossiella sp. S99.2]MCK2254995.1 hypothetical protein [Crossiella sp. S99.1]
MTAERVTPFLPDADQLVLAVLRAALPELPAADVAPLLPADLADRLRRFVAARRIGGAAPHPELLDEATVVVDCWAASRADAVELGRLCRTALYLAHAQQRVTAHGHLAGYRELSAPAELRSAGQAGRLHRVHATYALLIRPPI